MLCLICVQSQAQIFSSNYSLRAEHTRKTQFFIHRTKQLSLIPSKSRNQKGLFINYRTQSDSTWLNSTLSPLFPMYHYSLLIQKTKIIASGPITSWQIDGETVETVADFIFLGSKIIADGDCSHEIKRCLLLGRNVMTNLDSILKSRDITFSTKVHLVKAMVFPVVMYGCEESWVPKNWCFWTVVLEKTLESPLDCKEIQPVHSKGNQS